MNAPSLRIGTGFVRLGIIAIAVLAALFLLCADAAGGSPAGEEPELLDIGGIAQLDSLFRLERGAARLVLIFSPTCAECIRGARWLEKDVLKRHRSLPLRVYTVWFHRLPTDRRDLWPPTALPDSRVAHLWEHGSSIARYYGSLFKMRRPLAWNAHFLYAPGADSLGARDSVACWGGRSVSDDRERIREALEKLTGQKI